MIKLTRDPGSFVFERRSSTLMMSSPCSNREEQLVIFHFSSYLPPSLSPQSLVFNNLVLLCLPRTLNPTDTAESREDGVRMYSCMSSGLSHVSFIVTSHNEKIKITIQCCTSSTTLHLVRSNAAAEVYAHLETGSAIAMRKSYAYW